MFIVMGRDSVTDVNATDCHIPLQLVSMLFPAALDAVDLLKADCSCKLP